MPITKILLEFLKLWKNKFPKIETHEYGNGKSISIPLFTRNEMSKLSVGKHSEGFVHKKVQKCWKKPIATVSVRNLFSSVDLKFAEK